MTPGRYYSETCARLTWVGPDYIARQEVYAALRANLPYFAIACISFVAGVSALLLARLRLRDRLLLWAGLFSVLYAARLFLQNELVRGAFNSPGTEFFPWARCITYVIAIPYALFARELLGSGWRGAISIWLWLEVSFAVVAIPADLLGHQVYWAGLVNGVLVVGGTLLVLMHVVMKRDRENSFASGLTWPLVIFGIFVLLQNTMGRINFEPIGFLILLAGLGSTAARRALATERKLIDVEQELATARRIQNSIIPHAAPTVPALRVATRYQPMTSVAGDFYDFLKTGEHALTILVADVSGHGVPAALVASMLKICFAAQGERANHPAEILASLNVMLRGSLGGQYVTAACAAIDVQSRVITYAGAGHPPGLLLRADAGEVLPLAENGLFIGPFPHATYTAMTVPFDNGDKLLLYTDGIVEACGPDGEEFGRERLERFLVESKDKGPSEVVEQLFGKITNGAQQDDLTMVLVEFE